MLDMMRRHSKSWIIKVFLGIIIFVFIFYFGVARDSHKADLVAEIGEIPITRAAYAKAYGEIYNLYQNRLGNALDAEMIKKLDLKKYALNNIINEVIISRKAQELGIVVSVQDIQKALTSDPRFLNNGSFDEKKFSDFLAANRLNFAEYMQILTKNIIASNVFSFVQSGVWISMSEIKNFHSIQNLRMIVDFIHIPLREAAARITPSDEELGEYLAVHGNDLRLPERYCLKYIEYLGRDYESGINITAEEARPHYERFRDRYKRSPADKEPLPFDAVRGKVAADLRKISGMYAASNAARNDYEQFYQREDLDAYAREKGLEVRISGVFDLANPSTPFDKITDLPGAIQGLKSGAIGRLVTGENGYYIVVLEERREAALPALASVRGEVERRYRSERAAVVCQEQALGIIDDIKKGTSFSQAALKAGLQVRTSGIFSLKDGVIPGLGGNAALLNALLGISKANPVWEEPIALADGFVILKLKERIEPKDTNITNIQEIYNDLWLLKGRETFAYWLANLKEQMQQKGEIKYHRTVEEL